MADAPITFTPDNEPAQRCLAPLWPGSFAGVNIALSWAPFSGAVTAPAQVAANQIIRRPFEWLLFMSSLNQSVRERGNEGPKNGTNES